MYTRGVLVIIFRYQTPYGLCHASRRDAFISNPCKLSNATDWYYKLRKRNASFLQIDLERVTLGIMLDQLYDSTIFNLLRMLATGIFPIFPIYFALCM